MNASGRSALRRPWVAGLGLAVLSGIVTAPRDARANGYLTARFGSAHGTPAQPNGFALYFNPAALGGTKGTTITGDISVVARFASYTRTANALSPSTAALPSDQSYVSANTGKATLTNVLALPFLGVNTDFGTRNLRAGYAAYVPFGGQASWDRVRGVPGSPGSTDGPQRWQNISGQILAFYNTFAVAYRIHPRVSVGASISPVIHHVAIVTARNSNGSDDTVINGSLAEGRTYLDATGVNLAASAGIYAEPTDDLTLGLAYLSQPGFGETRMSGTLQTKLGSNATTKQDVDFIQTYPDIVRLGANWRASRTLVIRSDVELVRWSVFKRQCIVNRGDRCRVTDGGADLSNGKVILNIPRNWDNTIGVRVSPGYRINEDLEAFGSLGFTTSAVPRETIDASTIDSQTLYFAAGVRYEFNKHIALAGSYNHLYFFNVDTKGASNYDTLDPVSRSPSADGKYKSQVGFLNVNVAYTF